MVANMNENVIKLASKFYSDIYANYPKT